MVQIVINLRSHSAHGHDVTCVVQVLIGISDVAAAPCVAAVLPAVIVLLVSLLLRLALGRVDVPVQRDV